MMIPSNSDPLNGTGNTPKTMIASYLKSKIGLFELHVLPEGQHMPGAPNSPCVLIAHKSVGVGFYFNSNSEIEWLINALSEVKNTTPKAVYE